MFKEHLGRKLVFLVYDRKMLTSPDLKCWSRRRVSYLRLTNFKNNTS